MVSEQGVSALVRRARTGDRAAFDGLVRHYRASLLAVAFLRTSDMEAAEDLVQTVLTRAWEKLPDLQDPGAFLPWLRAILANACRSWYRRPRLPALSLDAGTDPWLLVDPGPQPLEAVLAREQQRALRQALVALPYANRVALLMHVWGDYSYQEIAAFTGVPVTTVEGRIHRARRQLGRLLPSEAGRRADAPAPARSVQQEKKPMRAPKPPATAQPLALVLFSEQFAALLETGVPLVRSLEILQDTAPPYGDTSLALRTSVEQGKALSAAMAARPGLFPPFYRTMVRAGEVGGMLEETLRRTADLMTREWKRARGRMGQGAPVGFLHPGSASPTAGWDALSADQQTTLLALFCETLGLLLLSGVPITQALRTVAELLPSDIQAKMGATVAAVIRDEPVHQSMEPLGILPRFALEMIAAGEAGGCLDGALERAAAVLEHDLDCRAPA